MHGENRNWNFFLYFAWRDGLLNYKRVLNDAKTAYFSGLIHNNRHNPRVQQCYRKYPISYQMN